MVYEFILKEEKVNPRQSTGLHLLVALAVTMSGAVTFFLYKLFNARAIGENTEALAQLKWVGVGIILLSLVMLGVIIFKNKWLMQKRINFIFRIIELLLMGFFTCFSVIEHITIPAFTYGILAVAVLLAIFWESGNNTMKIRVGDEGVKLPANMGGKSIEWKEIEKVLFRFGTLTVDCENKKLLQWNVNATSINSDTFEQYCDEQIEAGKTKRVADW